VIKRYLFVGLGGGIGALSRYVLIELTQKQMISFPYSTILINLIGAFLLTFSLNLAVLEFKINKEIQLAINVGLIGSFTTLSLIMTDTISLLSTPSLLILYYCVTIFGGLFMSYIAYLFACYLNKRGEFK